MRALSFVLCAIGALPLAAIVLFGGGLVLSAGDAGGETAVMGFFILIVLGIPAFGFMMLMVGLGGGAAATSLLSDARPKVPPPPPPQSGPGRTYHLLNRLCLIAAILWSAVFGLITFVAYVTEDPAALARFAPIWLIPFAALFALSRFFRRCSRHAP